MKSLTHLIIAISAIVSIGCTQSGGTEKWQTKRDNIVDVSDKMKFINTGDVFISQMGAIYLVDKYLMITDIKSIDKLIHIFDKDDFRYVESRVDAGRGPGEILRIGNIAYSQEHREAYVSDNGAQAIYTYPIDSLVEKRKYIPQKRLSHSKECAIVDYEYVNDTLAIGLGMVAVPSDKTGFKAVVAKMNFESGDVRFMEYEHPDIERPRFNCAVSAKDNIYVLCYAHHNLISICDLDGNLKYNIYGERWSTETSNKDTFYGRAVICKGKIVASYAGKERLVERDGGSTGVNYPDKLIIFDLDGDYVKTLELGHQIHMMRYDEDNDRLIFTLQNDINQFGYLDLKGIL